MHLIHRFSSSIKIQATGISPLINNYHQQPSNNSKLNNHQTNSFKHSIARTRDNIDDSYPNGRLLTIENRPMTGPGSVKHLKYSDTFHSNTKLSQRGILINDANEMNRKSNRSHSYESSDERFQNLLTVVRAPYTSGNGTLPNTPLSITPSSSKRPLINQSGIKGSLLSSRSTSARGSLGIYLTPNTITI